MKSSTRFWRGKVSGMACVLLTSLMPNGVSVSILLLRHVHLTRTMTALTQQTQQIGRLGTLIRQNLLIFLTCPRTSHRMSETSKERGPLKTAPALQRTGRARRQESRRRKGELKMAPKGMLPKDRVQVEKAKVTPWRSGKARAPKMISKAS